MTDLKKLDSVIKDLEDQSNYLKDFNGVYSEIGKLKSDISENLNLLKSNNDGFESLSSQLEKKLESSLALLKQLESDLLKRIQELYQDNKNYQKDLDSTLVTRLEKNKSDIQVELRNEGSQIQRGLENSIDSKLNKMESKLENILETQKKQLSNLKIIIIVLVVITLGSIAVSLIY